MVKRHITKTFKLCLTSEKIEGKYNGKKIEKKNRRKIKQKISLNSINYFYMIM